MARLAESDAAERQIRDLMRDEANSFCADCSAKSPMELNLTMGTFVCRECAIEHRSAKRRVKSLETGSLMYDDAELMAAVGNARANSHWLANWNPREFPEPKPGDASALREFLWLKYEGSWAKPGARNPAEESRDRPGPPPGYDTVRGGPPPPPRRGGYDAYDTYRAPPPPRHSMPPARYGSESSSDSDRGKSKSKKSSKKSSKKKKSHSSKKSSSVPTIGVDGSAWKIPSAEDIPIGDQLRLMFGEASVVQTPLGWRVMTPTHGLVFPQVAFNMGFARMSQPQAVQMLQRKIVAQRQQALMAQAQLQREAAARHQQAEILQAQAKMIRKGGPAALNMVRMQQQQRAAMMAAMQGGQLPVQQLEYGNAFAQQMPNAGMQAQHIQAQQAHQMQQMQPQVQMPPQPPMPPAAAPLALPAPPRSLTRNESQAGDSVKGGGGGGDILGGMAGGIDPQDLLMPMNGAGASSEVNLYADLGAPAPAAPIVPPPPPGAAPSGSAMPDSDNPFAEFEGLGANGQANPAPSAEQNFVLPADNPFG